MSAWEHESRYQMCTMPGCDHIFEYSGQCEGSPKPCQACCSTTNGDLLYAPTYVISELGVLT